MIMKPVPLDPFLTVAPLRLVRFPAPQAAAVHPMRPEARASLVTGSSKAASSSLKAALPKPGLIVVGGKDVTRREVAWLWPDRIALGKVTLFIGDPGAGKSYLTHDLVARVTTGKKWPDASGKAPLAHVIIVNAEDDPEDTLCPRLDALGADDTRYHVVISTSAEQGKWRLFNLQTDLLALEAVIIKHGAKLVIIDPLGTYLGSKIDASRMEQVYPLLTTLGALARKHQVAIVVVLHLNKASDKSAIHRAMGSMAFPAAARAVFSVSKDKSDPARRLLATVKFNSGPEPSTLAFRISEGRVDWEGPTGMTADQALSGVTPDSGHSELKEAEAFLTDLLDGGPVPAKEIKQKASEAGYSWATLRRAKDRLGVEAVKEPGKSGRWMWKKLDLREGMSALSTLPNKG